MNEQVVDKIITEIENEIKNKKMSLFINSKKVIKK